MITCQALYDRREERAEISGDDLHEIFDALVGEPSPSGRRRTSRGDLLRVAGELRERHRAGGGVGGRYLLDMAEFCEKFK